ncbi:MAG: hypothetical protein EOO09_02395 [Chitinophagaceae bacterium]|nr:MAG: hypothetical protein EOO09_02395 [Chitinophagaceae bacterium]
MAVGIIDLIRPYFFAGFDAGAGLQELLSKLHVDEYDTAWDEEAVLISGIARIDSTDNESPFYSPSAGGGNSPDTPFDQWVKFDVHDILLKFRLSIAREAAGALDVSGLSVTFPGKPELVKVLEALNTGGDRSDYPNTRFRLDLMGDVSASFPTLIGAKLQGHLLVPDPDNRTVRISIPDFLITITQDSAEETTVDSGFSTFVDSFDQSDDDVNYLPEMTPAYALFPGEQFGFGYRKGILDLSADSTPPDLLEKFGLGDDWKGIYLPEALFFASTQKSAGVAFNVMAKELMIGFAPTNGIWGDISADIDFLGEELKASVRFYNKKRKPFTPREIINRQDIKAVYHSIELPPSEDFEEYFAAVEISSGAAPFSIIAVSKPRPDTASETYDDAFFTNTANSPQDITITQQKRLSTIDQRLVIRVTSRNPLQRKILVVDIRPSGVATVETASDTPAKTPQASLVFTGGSLRPGLSVRQDKKQDELFFVSGADENTVVKVNGSPVTLANGQFRAPVDNGGTASISVDWPGSSLDPVMQSTVRFKTRYPVDDDTPGHVVPGDNFSLLVKRFKESPDTGKRIRVDGYASQTKETDRDTKYNDDLSKRRAAHVANLVKSQLPLELRPAVGEAHWGNDRTAYGAAIDQQLTTGHVKGNQPSTQWIGKPGYRHSEFEIAVVSFFETPVEPQNWSATLSRPPATETPKVDIAPATRQPDWLRQLGLTVRFEKEWFPVAAEVRMTIDYKTAHEEGLEKFRTAIDEQAATSSFEEQMRLPQGPPNPDDGVVEFRLAISRDKSTGEYSEFLSAKAADTDLDGLWQWGELPTIISGTIEPETDPWRDIAGLFFTLAPLLAGTPAERAERGRVEAIAVNLGIPVGVTVLGLAHVLQITHYGVELLVQHNDGDYSASVLVDMEVALWLNFKIGGLVLVTNQPHKPVKLRYKAIGFGFDSSGLDSLHVVFDPSKGYTIDLADSGSLKVLPALGDKFGDIIQVLGARIARTNPLNVEVDLGMAADLGVFSIDKFSFRVPVDPLGVPTITALGVGVNVEGVLNGKGYLEIKENGFAGQLDVLLPSIGLRIAGSLAIRSVTEGDRSAMATFVAITVEYPSGIPMGGTGLAIFGFLGLFAMHHRRNETAGARNPALDWLVNRVQGDPTKVTGWDPALDKWAFGLGVVAGTIEGATILNIKGMLALELPGPRVLLFVKADILTKKPETKAVPTGKLMAVVDISPARILIGIEFAYKIDKVLDLKIPVEAGFFMDDISHFYVDAGTIARPATARILQLFDGTAYFMLHGDGIPDFPLGALQGLSVATGFRVSFIWGNTSVGLYLKVAAGFDVGIGFQPLFFAGRVYLEGELRLFIISIEAHGKLEFLSNGIRTRIKGEVCGRVDFFFFSVKGCVKFSIGNKPDVPDAPPLFKELLLQSRSYALLDGSGVDRGIDNILCHGTSDGSVPSTEVRNGDTVILADTYVPIDSIPLIQMEVAPEVVASSAIDGTLSSGLPAGFGGWQKRGQNYLRYTLGSVTLKLVAVNGQAVPAGTAAVIGTERPYTWRHPAQQPGGDGLPVELALLDWKPTNIDRAMVQGPELDNVVDGRWGGICTPVAKAAPVLWSFRYSLLGSSAEGWLLKGEVWPDQPGSHRSSEPDIQLKVRETWRTGTFVDALLGTSDAVVTGISAACPRPPRRPLPDHFILHDELLTRARERVLPEDDSPEGFTPVVPVREILGRSIAARQQLCAAKVLQAPYERPVNTAALTDSPFAEPLSQLEAQLKEQLRDVIRLSGGPFTGEARLLVYARIKMVDKGLLRFRAFNSKGTEVTVSASFTMVDELHPVPAPWTDQNGPWWDDVFLARQYFRALEKRGWAEFIVTIKLPEAVAKIDIGVSPLVVAIEEFDMKPPSFYLALVEALSVYEVLREEGDTEESGDDQQGLEDGLTNSAPLPWRDRRRRLFIRTANPRRASIPGFLRNSREVASCIIFTKIL